MSFLLLVCFVVFFVLGATALLVAYRYFRGGRTTTEKVQRLDLEAFSALLDPEDEIYLRVSFCRPPSHG